MPCKLAHNSALCTWHAFCHATQVHIAMQLLCTIQAHVCTAITLLENSTVMKGYVRTIPGSFHEVKIQLVLLPVISYVAKKDNLTVYMFELQAATLLSNGRIRVGGTKGTPTPMQSISLSAPKQMIPPILAARNADQHLWDHRRPCHSKSVPNGYGITRARSTCH